MDKGSSIGSTGGCRAFLYETCVHVLLQRSEEAVLVFARAGKQNNSEKLPNPSLMSLAAMKFLPGFTLSTVEPLSFRILFSFWGPPETFEYPNF